jgi:hypothetical protein
MIACEPAEKRLERIKAEKARLPAKQKIRELQDEKKGALWIQKSQGQKTNEKTMGYGVI